MLISSKYMALCWLPLILTRVSIMVPFSSCARVLPRGTGAVGLKHRSSIAPSPLAGEGWDRGRKQGQTPRATPGLSRRGGRKFAQTGSPNDYLTDVLGARSGVAAVCVEVFGGECCRHGGGGSRPFLLEAASNATSPAWARPAWKRGWKDAALNGPIRTSR